MVSSWTDAAQGGSAKARNRRGRRSGVSCNKTNYVIGSYPAQFRRGRTMKYRRADMLLPVASEAVLPAILFASGPSCGPLASLGLDRDVVKENIPADAIG